MQKQIIDMFLGAMAIIYFFHLFKICFIYFYIKVLNQYFEYLFGISSLKLQNCNINNLINKVKI